jgi:hypothetical protein
MLYSGLSSSVQKICDCFFKGRNSGQLFSFVLNFQNNNICIADGGIKLSVIKVFKWLLTFLFILLEMWGFMKIANIGTGRRAMECAWN